MMMENLKYRRQFLFSPKKCTKLKNWQIVPFGKYYIHVHPDCEVNYILNNSRNVALIGYIIDPKYPKKNNAEVLQELYNYKSIQNIPKKLYGLTGRFILIFNDNSKYRFFHDPCGLRMMFYAKQDGYIYASSQPLLLNLVIPIKKGFKYRSYLESQYVKYDNEHYFPSGVSLYDNVEHLVPNHYLDSSSFTQIRYWPDSQLISEDFEIAANKIAKLLKDTLYAVYLRYKIALPVTAGWDTRIILSACKDIANNIYFYTLKYGNLTDNSADIKIPEKLFSKLSFPHQIIDCNKTISDDFLRIYNNNTDTPHKYWSLISAGMYKNFPKERINIKGNCSEIVRCFYYPNGKYPKIIDDSYLINLVDNWKHIDFIKTRLSEWIQEIKIINNDFGYNILDLFYWEHRMGSWQAQSQLEGDIIHETFTPFNNRELLDIMLSVDVKQRCKINRYNKLYIEVMSTLWKEVLSEPVNPLSNIQKIKTVLKKIMNTNISKKLFLNKYK